MKRPLLLLPLLAFAASSAIAAGFVLADDGCPRPLPPLVDEARFPEPAVTIDGETVATLGDVNELFDPRTCFLGGYSRAQVAQGFADDFLLAREAKARGAESVEVLLADGLAEPTEDDLRAEWARDLEENPALGRVEVRVEASHILALCPRTATEEEEAAARAKIGALRERVLAGEDFAAVAREASDCPSRDRGGALGWFGHGVMVPEFEQAAFSQPVGETGEPVRTEYGFHLVLVTGREPVEPLLLGQRRLGDPANPTNNIPVFTSRDAAWTPVLPPSRTSLSNAFESIAAGADAAAKGGFYFDSLDPVPRAVLRSCEARPGFFPWHMLNAVRPFGADAPTNGVRGDVFLGPDDGRPFPDRTLAVFHWTAPATTRILRFAGDCCADEPALHDPLGLLYDFEVTRVDLEETTARPALLLRGFYRHKGIPAELVVEIGADGEFVVREASRHAESERSEFSSGAWRFAPGRTRDARR